MHFARRLKPAHPHNMTPTSGNPTFSTTSGGAGGGGGGGSSFDGAEGNLYASSAIGSGLTPPNTDDPDYAAGRARGGTVTGWAVGGSGLCVIRAYSGDPVAAGLVTP